MYACVNLRARVSMYACVNLRARPCARVRVHVCGCAALRLYDVEPLVDIVGRQQRLLEPLAQQAIRSHRLALRRLGGHGEAVQGGGQHRGGNPVSARSLQFINCIVDLISRLIPIHQLLPLSPKGWEPDPLASHLMCVLYMNIRDDASGSSACDNCLSPHFL